MFIPIKSDDGAVLPWEYLAGAAGTYKAGQLLKTDAGQLTSITADLATTPQYMCMADITVAAGENIPVTRVKPGYIYETTLATDVSSAVVGSKLKVAAGGLEATTGTGTFELVYLEGTTTGATVRGRWSK